MNSRNAIFAAILLTALLLICAGAGLLPTIWQLLDHTVVSIVAFLWSLIPK